jgi:hypothetical protein
MPILNFSCRKLTFLKRHIIACVALVDTNSILRSVYFIFVKSSSGNILHTAKLLNEMAVNFKNFIILFLDYEFAVTENFIILNSPDLDIYM